MPRYCIASVEILPFEVQLFIKQKWEDLLDPQNGVYRGSDKYKLIMVCGKEEKQQVGYVLCVCSCMCIHTRVHAYTCKCALTAEQVVTDFGRFTRQKLRSLQQDVLKNLLVKYFESQHINVEVFTSRYAGQGKTKMIKDWCATRGYPPAQVVAIS